MRVPNSSSESPGHRAGLFVFRSDSTPPRRPHGLAQLRRTGNVAAPDRERDLKTNSKANRFPGFASAVPASVICRTATLRNPAGPSAMLRGI